MTPPSYTGLTWDHPRGYNALAQAARTIAPLHGLSIEWDRQLLDGFESHPIAELCARYDLVVLDHPHVGEAVEAACLTSLEEVFEPRVLAAIATATIGPCLSSYCYGGRHWALPLDAAAQVVAWRPDLIDTPPDTWGEVERAAGASSFALSLAGPHAILNLLSIVAAFGRPPAEQEPDVLLDEEMGTRALELLARLYAKANRPLLQANPIDILEHMGRHDDAAFCPLIYGYVNYASRRPARHQLAFADAPAAVPGGRRGSTLGGTGIGISRRTKVTPELVMHLSWLLGEAAQLSFIPDHDGQPSFRRAWTDDRINRRWGNFYRATVATLETAYVRPRYRGWIAFQTEASDRIRAALAEHRSPRGTVRELNHLHRNSIGDRQL